ncbi:MAG: hypothetical protein R3E96_12905 [Planctomycetota bacterium]
MSNASTKSGVSGGLKGVLLVVGLGAAYLIRSSPESTSLPS